MKEREIGFQVRTLSNLIRRNFENFGSVREQQCLTGAHGWVIGYLYSNRHRDVYQRDFEAEFSIRRSTITKMLTLMEKNGLITRESVEDDARLKKIVLTKKASLMQKQVFEDISVLEKKMSKGIDPDELEIFFNTVNKIKANLEE
ncbi:MAG: MarR family transcriptional regulator [Clostridia bacterium]|nr:MarR family transcriptional regulator [Clostridia bacterium]